MGSKSRAMGIRGRAPAAHPRAGTWIEFQSRDGETWQVICDSTGYAYPVIDGCQVTSTSTGYAFSVQSALKKALTVLEN